MGKDIRKKKQEFFDIGSKALSSVSAYQNLYACPICQVLLGVSAIDTGELTLEDSPPRSMGGKPIALTCKSCNSTAGHTIDAAVKHRENFVEHVRGLAGSGGKFGGKARLSTAGVTTNIRLHGSGKYVTFEIPEKVNNPEHFRKQRGARPPREPVRDGDPSEFKIHLRSHFKWRDACVGDLKSAYIAAFARCGYRYAFDSTLDLVREQILHPDKDLTRGACWYNATDPPSAAKILSLEAPFRGLLVQLGRGMVGLPWGSDPKDFYARLHELLSGGTAEFTATPLGWPSGMEMQLDLARQIPPGGQTEEVDDEEG